MGYKWKPNKAQKEAYIQRMREREQLPIRAASGAIRKGCTVEFYSVARGEVVRGVVCAESYGADKHQHTFTVDLGGEKMLVKGRNLYPNIIEHIPGEISKNL